MRRFVGAYAAGLLVLVIAVLWPLWWPFEPIPYNPEAEGPPAADQRVEAFHAEFTVDADGTLHAIERITIDVADDESHGIYRFFDLYDENIADHRPEPVDVTVAVDPDGTTPDADDWRRDAAYTLVTHADERIVSYRIGDGGTTLPRGEHTYEIRYRWPDALSVDGDTTRFLWDVLPSWDGPIRQASVTVDLPGDAADVSCARGWGAEDNCVAMRNVHDASRVSAPSLVSLDPHTPVTLSMDVDVPAPPGAPVVGGPASVEAASADRSTIQSLARVVGWPPFRHSIAVTFLLAALPYVLVALLLLPVPLVLMLRSREKPPAFPLLMEPPAGVGPAQAAYILSESTSGAAFSGSVLYAAERGLLTLTSTDRGWRSKEGPNQNWGGVDEVTRELKYLRKGNGVAFADQSVVGPIFARFAQAAPQWAKEAGLVAPDGASRALLWLIGAIFSGASLVASLILADLTPADVQPTIHALVPGVLAAGALALLSRHGRFVLWLGAWFASTSMLVAFLVAYVGAHPVPTWLQVLAFLAGAGVLAGHIWAVHLAGNLVAVGPDFQRRTAAGRDLWMRAGGFRRALATDAAEARFDFAARKELYATYLPWAVAFGVADAWARKVHAETGEQVPGPEFLPGTFSWLEEGAPGDRGGDRRVGDARTVADVGGAADLAAAADRAISRSISDYVAAHPVAHAGGVFRTGTFDWLDSLVDAAASSSGGSGGGSSRRRSSGGSSRGGGGGGGGGGGRW